MPNYTNVKPLFWYRYVDDILCLVDSDFDLDNFLCFINNIYSSLKFTYEWENEGKISFLDVLIHNCNDHLKFSVFRKKTNADAYLHFYAFTHVHLKINVAQNLFLRALRICDIDFLDNELCYIRSSLSKLAYPKHILDRALQKARRSFSNSQSNKYE